MKLGGFGRKKDFQDMVHAGFNYAELDIPEIEALSEKEFAVFCEEVSRSGVPVLTGARALPVSEPWFFTDQFRALEYQPYLERACRRGKALGMRKMIIGNGKARWLPEETSIKKEVRFIDFLCMFSEIAGEKEIEVILEPLGPRYSNYINTVPQAVRVIEEVGAPNLFTMADLRHFYGAGEALSDIVTYRKYIHHLHVDNPLSFPARDYPKVNDPFDYTEFLESVKASGYQDTLTVEADIPSDWRQAYRDVAEVLQEIR